MELFIDICGQNTVCVCVWGVKYKFRRWFSLKMIDKGKCVDFFHKMCFPDGLCFFSFDILFPLYFPFRHLVS